jgi:hypothetical protein
MLMTNPKMLTSMIWLDNVGLALCHSMVKISEEFLFENKNKTSSSMVILPTKAICRYQCINILHMLACDPLSFAKLL